MKSIIFVCFFVFFTDSVIPTDLPNSFKICHRKDPNFQQCLKAAINDYFKQSTKAYPAIGLNQVDPYLIEQFSIDAGSHGTVNFDQHYKHVYLHGLSTITVSMADFDFDKKLLKMEGIVPLAELTGQYDFNGRLLVLPIQGNGDFHYKLVNLDIMCEIAFEESVRHDNKYYKVVDTKIHLKVDKLDMHLDNLFNGNQQLSDTLKGVIDENWKAVFEDVRSGYEKLFATIMKTETSSLFSRVPIDAIFPE